MKFNNVKLGIAPIGWSNDDMPELGADISFVQCIQEMAAAGFSGCEVGHKFPRDPVMLGKELAQHNLSVASAWFSLYFTEDGREQETIAGFINHMHFLKAMGARVIVVCECGNSIQGKPLALFANKPEFSHAQWNKLINGLHKIGELAKLNGMIIVYHHHMGTGIQQHSEINQLMENTNPDIVSLLLDTGHLTFAGEDPLQIILNHGKRIRHVHLKDIRQHILQQVISEKSSFLDAVKSGVFTVPGDGCINFQPVFEALSDLSYQGWWIVEAEQDPAIANPLKYAKMARQFVSAATGL